MPTWPAIELMLMILPPRSFMCGNAAFMPHSVASRPVRYVCSQSSSSNVSSGCRIRRTRLGLAGRTEGLRVVDEDVDGAERIDGA